LHKLLYYSYGIRKSSKTPDDIKWSYRFVPSAGGLYPMEIYVAVFNSSIGQGIYHYNPEKNSLIMIKEGDYTMYLQQNAGANPWVDLSTASCMVLTTSFFERQLIKYGERAYRFMLMEIGFVAQNMNLISETIGLGTCMLGFYHDDKINDMLGINGVGETIQNVLVIGKPKTNKAS